MYEICVPERSVGNRKNYKKVGCSCVITFGRAPHMSRPVETESCKGPGTNLRT